jgi:hypothetical protein
MDVEKELLNNKTLLIVLPSSRYSQSVLKIAKKLTGKKVLFITLNKTYPFVEELLNKNGCDTKYCFFIDAISSALKNVKKQKKCYFLKNPSALTELSIAISESMGKFEYVIFDSISTLMIYNNPSSVEKFVSSITNKLRTGGLKSVFFILEGEKSLKAMSMFFENVLEPKDE